AGPGCANSGYLVETPDARVLVDCGAGVIGRLLPTIDPARVDGILISHTHCDHCVDLLALRYVLRRRGGPFPKLYLPPGGRTALQHAADALNPPGAGRALPADFPTEEYDSDGCLPLGDLRIRFHPVVHYVPTWAISLEAGRRLIYSADTGLFDGVDHLAEGADLFLCEATYQDA